MMVVVVNGCFGDSKTLVRAGVRFESRASRMISDSTTENSWGLATTRNWASKFTCDW